MSISRAKRLIWCFTADGTRATWVRSGVSKITMINILLKLAVHFSESLQNTVRLDSVLHKVTGGSVAKNEAKTLPSASMFKKKSSEPEISSF